MPLAGSFWGLRPRPASPLALPAPPGPIALLQEAPAITLGMDIRHRVIYDADLSLYLLVKSNACWEMNRLATCMLPRLLDG